MKRILVLGFIIPNIFLIFFALSCTSEPFLLFDKATYTLFLRAGERVLFKTIAGYGLPGKHPKESRGDFLTPEGSYQIVRVNPSSQYFYFAEVNYPNLNDLALAYFLKRISLEDLKNYLSQQKAEERIKKILGDKIGIHGGGSFKKQGNKVDFNWTQGCIALDNEDLKMLLPYLKPGTKVYIINSSNSLFELVKKLAYPKTVKPLDFWEGGLYLNKEQNTRLILMIKEEYGGKRGLLYEEWMNGRLKKRVISGVDGRFPLDLENKLKEELIKHIHTLEDPYPERMFETWK